MEINLFVFGTLRHTPVLEIVLGRSAADLKITPDAVPGWTVSAAAEGPFPMIAPDPGGTAHGLLIADLDEADIARLRFYEAGYDFDLVPAHTKSGAEARLFVPQSTVFTPDGLWDLDAWVAKWGAMTEHAAREVMGLYGTVSADEVARRYPRIRARAWSKVLAQTGRHGAGTLAGEVAMEHRQQSHSNFFVLEEMRLRHSLFDGDLSPALDRTVFVTSDATLVLPYDPVRDRVLLVEQIRMGPIARHDPHVWQLEPIAGLIDPGETPEETARREALEEAGLVLNHLEPAGECYASPGAATDFFHLFVGRCDLPDDSAGIGGAPDEGENIRSHLMSFEALLQMAEARQMANAPLTLLTYWLAHHRDGLRARS